jgi:hypothetical protein
MTYSLIDKYPPVKPMEVLQYELYMLNEAFSAYHSSLREPVKSMILESFLIHARNLIDFLENKRLSPDDITCIDFTDIDGKPVSRIDVELKGGLKTQINKRVAHMSKARTDSQVSWIMGEIHQRVNIDISSFLDGCGDSNFPDDPDQWRRAFKELIVLP